jgi:hypothetical protein
MNVHVIFYPVRAKLEYASVVSNSITSTDANKLEHMQQKSAALRFNFSFPKSITVILILYSIVMDLLKELLGNGSINTFQRATMETVSQWTNIIARC